MERAPMETLRSASRTFLTVVVLALLGLGAGCNPDREPPCELTCGVQNGEPTVTIERCPQCCPAGDSSAKRCVCEPGQLASTCEDVERDGEGRATSFTCKGGNATCTCTVVYDENGSRTECEFGNLGND